MIKIDVYSRNGCGGCERVKSRLNSLGISYKDHSVDEVGKDFIKENFPGHNALPIVVIDGMVYSGAPNIEAALKTYGADFGKELLSE